MNLRDFTTPREVPRYHCAIAPGKHCPLFGIGAVLRGVQGITLIYVGTQDCVYYAQRESLENSLSSGHPGFRVLAAQLDDSDLIFGIRPQMEQLLEQEAKREGTKAVFLVTSCSVEVLSEDLGSVVRTVAQRTGKRIALIPSENFKTFSYFPGMELALTALAGWLEPTETRKGCFALLGARHRGADQCEPVVFLRQRGYEILCNLPYDTSLQQIEKLPEAEFSLVVDGTGLGVAQLLEEKFGIPYVRFDEKLNLAAVAAGWRKLGDLLEEDLTPFISRRMGELQVLAARVSAAVTGKTFFYSQVILYPFETCLFLTKLGMIPSCIFLGSVTDRTDDARKALAERANPRMLQNASNSAVEAMLREAAPDYFIGAVGRMIENYPVTHVNFRTIPMEAGFAFIGNCLQQLLEAEQGGSHENL